MLTICNEKVCIKLEKKKILQNRRIFTRGLRNLDPTVPPW